MFLSIFLIWFGWLTLGAAMTVDAQLRITPEFARASQDRFFLCVESADPLFDADETRAFLQSLNPVNVSDVDP